MDQKTASPQRFLEVLEALLRLPAMAVGTSTQPLSARQRQLGLDVLPVSNGGRVVQVFKTGETFMTGQLDRDRTELPRVRDDDRFAQARFLQRGRRALRRGDRAQPAQTLWESLSAL